MSKASIIMPITMEEYHLAIQSAYAQGKAEGRADAIDEFLNELKNYALWEEHETILEIVAEQIKEKAE